MSAEQRLSEATNSLKVLGLGKERIFILGYGDGSMNIPGHDRPEHVFCSGETPITSPAGHSETYGAAGLQDFAFIARGVHSAYCGNNYRQDLKELILTVKADIIIATDFDVHQDHRMLSLSFDTVMGEILSRPGNDYFPEVFRRFAYCTAYHAKPDLFDSDFILSTAKPEEETSQGLIDTSYYTWPERVRFPVPEKSREPYARNILTKAINQHKSQNKIYIAFARAEGIINSDEVFWRRRTDSLSFSAKVTATSGNPAHAHDFRLFNVSDIFSRTPKRENYLWIPDEDDNAKELIFTWDSPQEISQAKLWGNIDGVPVQRVSITMDSGYNCEVGPLPEKGLPLTLNIPAQKGVRECRVKILSQGSKESGLAEIEFFAENEQPPVVKPFIQIMTGGNFVYIYPRKPDEIIVPAECYAYRCDEAVKYSVEGPASFDGENLRFEPGNNDDVVLTAETESGIYCRSVFRAVSMKDIMKARKIRAREKRRIRFAVFTYPARKRILKYMTTLRKGPAYLLKRLAEKVAGKIRKMTAGR